MSLREDMWKYEQITGESAEHVPIIKLGAFLDGYEMAIKALEQQPSADCISREAIKKLKKYCLSYVTNTTIPKADIFVKIADIKELPSVIPSRPKGKWKILDECANEGVYCSECHKKVFKLEFSPTMKWRNFKYCPNCGAEMEMENEKETC